MEQYKKCHREVLSHERNKRGTDFVLYPDAVYSAKLADSMHLALVDEEATVKRFYKRGESIVLHPENPLYEDIVATQVTILGKVVYLMRTYEEV